ncbi:MAG: hypothetical protein ACKVU2_05740 [Saprospiraceae bacterium]
MRIYKLWMAVVLMLAAWGMSAHVPYPNKTSGRDAKRVEYRGVCASSRSFYDMELNNVRARLLGGGDCWWDFTDGRYIVPKVDVATGQREVSSIFAGSVWLGGVDPGGSLKLACQDFRPSGRNDFWPGPLNETGTTEEQTCTNWDRHFRVTGDEIRRHLSNLASGDLNPDNIPRGVKGWPARGNPYFADVWGFDLPYTTQALAGFYDADGITDYDPLKGDYPSIEIRGCALDRYPDEMVFWIYNDQGGGAPHARTNGDAIQMEVQVQAFSYLTNDELNDMTFQRYKLINRATERIDSMFFAMWVDPDLGCYLDDYIGCDSTKDLMYVYNQDATDGQPNCDCAGVNTYCDKVPILGVDYFRGPLDEDGDEIGMSSFVYYNNPGVGEWPAAQEDPQDPLQFYRYLTGHWADGRPFTEGGSGYMLTGGTPTRYALSDPPNDPNGWSMCTANLPFGDRRTLQASGPFRLQPGAVNELIIGIPWVPDIDYPCPDLENLFRADKLAQGLFDNCFDLLDGPDAPNVDWVEMHQQVIAVLTNKFPSNNVNEDYGEYDILAPDSIRFGKDSLTAKYLFEGYLIYQVANPNVSTADFDDPEKSRIVYQVDVLNGVSKLYNWVETRNPFTNDLNFHPELMVDGGDKGVRHTFPISEDRFATGNDKRLINHKKYYYAVIAYGYNNISDFNPLIRPVTGQQRPYLPSRKGGDGPIKIYTVVPRSIVDRVLNSTYGDGVAVKRLEGRGNTGNFLDFAPGTYDMLFTPGLTDTILEYKVGRGPITVTIFNPLEVKNGDYELRFIDGNLTDTKLDPDARWELRKLPDGAVIASERSIARLNEQIVAQYGFSVSIGQLPLTGSYAFYKDKNYNYPNPGESNGAIGATIEYTNPTAPWLAGFADTDAGFLNFVKTNKGERDDLMDPFKSLSTMGNGWFVPYALTDWELDSTRFVSPAWTPEQLSLSGTAMGTADVPTNSASRYFRLANLPNVDIVLTSDTSRWSRCIVVESASRYFTSGDYPKNPALDTESGTNKKRSSFDTRYALSVGKADLNNDSLPDPDGAKDQNGQPLRGMGWFPGYAIDVETGQRLNIFFGENSCFSAAVDKSFTGRDMMWNPTNQAVVPNPLTPFDYYNFVLGGYHWIYVTNTAYDQCEAIRRRFHPEAAPSLGAADVWKRPQIASIAWAGMVMLAPDAQMRTLRQGLIPNETVIKLRVSRQFDNWYNDADSKKKTGLPKYQFKIDGRQSTDQDNVQIANALDSIKVVPNPYYGFSQYETSQFSNVIKITNLPAKCNVTIYSLDGKFIRQYRRDEVYAPYQQITPDLEWDLKNSKGIPVASGVYLIQVQAPGLGDRTIKWFGVARQFDPSGL